MEIGHKKNSVESSQRNDLNGLNIFLSNVLKNGRNDEENNDDVAS
jgi:hypothetical protein